MKKIYPETRGVHVYLSMLLKTSNWEGDDFIFQGLR